MLYQLNDQGYPAFLLYENDLYKVQVGAFQQIGNAINMEQRLRDDGYSTVIVTKKISHKGERLYEQQIYRADQ